jgi:hypothetical protein
MFEAIMTPHYELEQLSALTSLIAGWVMHFAGTALSANTGTLLDEAVGNTFYDLDLEPTGWLLQV